VANLETLPDPIIASSSDPSDEQKRIDRTRKWVEDESERIHELLGLLEDGDLELKIRFVRALSGLLPPGETSFGDWLVSEHDRFLFYLLDGLEQPLSESTFRDVKPFVDHDTQWVAGAAFAALGRSYGRNPDFVKSALRNETRKPVLVRALKSLYDRRAEGFSSVLKNFLHQTYSDQVRFYAAVLLKTTDSPALKDLSANDPYLMKILESVPVTSEREKAIQN
jgi:hypothetical protein